MRVLGAIFGLLVATLPAWAAGETVPALGLTPGASPNTLCIFDKSPSRPCVTIGTLDSVTHIFTGTAAASAPAVPPFNAGGYAGLGFLDNAFTVNQAGNVTAAGIDTSRALTYVTGPTVNSTAFLYSGNVTGVCDGSILDPATSGKDCALFRVYTGVTSLTWPATTPLPVFSVSATVGAGAQGGGITAGQFQLSENATTGMLTAHPFIALQAGVQAVRNEGGSAGVPGGGMWSLITYATLGGTGTFWNQVIGYEMDVSVNSLSASVADVIGMQIVETGTHVVKGTRSNEAISLQGGKLADIPTVGWDCGFCFGGYNGYNPMNTGATLIGTWGHAVSGAPGSGAMGTVANGVDISQYIFTGSAFKSPGFSVDGAGIITGSAYKAGATAGVTCSGAPTASFASTLGIVTHC